MKKAVKIFVVVFIAVLLAGMLIACNKEPETITISFETNGGLEVPAVTINVGDDFEAPTPVRAGYIFKGWFVDESLSMPFDGAPTHNITLFAKWAVAIGVVFDGNGGTGSMASLTEGAGYPFTLPQNAFTKSGHVFAGWATTPDGDAVYGDRGTVTATESITLYAVWVDIDSLVNPEQISQGYILFGEYPQTLKADDVTITETKDARGYYLGGDGKYYAKVTATPFNEERYEYQHLFGPDYDNRKLMQPGEDYYFKVEPIKWRILEQGNGTYTLIADIVLDTQIFDETSVFWHESYVREWLNGSFYNVAFSFAEKSLIQNARVATNYDTYYNGQPDYEFETYDYLFLPSHEVVNNANYGFGNDNDRSALCSDYSRARGVFVATYSEKNQDLNFGKAFYTTRTPKDPHNVYRVQYIGSVERTNPMMAGNGIRPMMILEIPA